MSLKIDNKIAEIVKRMAGSGRSWPDVEEFIGSGSKIVIDYYKTAYDDHRQKGMPSVAEQLENDGWGEPQEEVLGEPQITTGVPKVDKDIPEDKFVDEPMVFGNDAYGTTTPEPNKFIPVAGDPKDFTPKKEAPTTEQVMSDPTFEDVIKPNKIPKEPFAKINIKGNTIEFIEPNGNKKVFFAPTKPYMSSEKLEHETVVSLHVPKGVKVSNKFFETFLLVVKAMNEHLR